MATTSTTQTPSIFPLLLVNFIGTLGYSIILPFLVFLVTRFGGNAIIYGVLGAVYPTFQLVGAPILGRWSDTHGRRKILLLSQAGTLFSWVIFLVALLIPIQALAKFNSGTFGLFTITIPLLVLFVARALDGLTGGNVSVANAYLADISNDTNRKANFGKLSASANLGFIVGPLLAGTLGATSFGEIIPVLAAIAISFVAVFVIYKYLPESKCTAIDSHIQKEGLEKILSQAHKDCYEVENPQKVRFKDVIKIPHLPYMFLLYFLIFLGFNIFYTAFPIHAIAKDGLGWSIMNLGIFFSILGGLMVAVQGPLLSHLSKKLSDEVLTIAGSFILIFHFILLSTGHLWLVYISTVFFALGNGLMWASFLSILAKIPPPHYQGYVQGIANSFGSLASIMGLIIGGIIYSSLGSYTFLLAAGIIFIVFLACLPMLRFTYHQKK
ncbi:MFS transporter [uncultured Microscilla sp.]|uniref:MFS transporter n=1 Tax=uncultured Microscilla sp. TaxID=432653 RepID=UPI00261403E7|nr:MFS transporter [uncultured Microscilla sp.]